MRQLTSDEAAHLDSIMGMAIGEVPAQVPTASHASTEATFQGNAGTDPARPVEHDPGHGWQGELAPEVPSKRLRTETPLSDSKAITTCRRGSRSQPTDKQVAPIPKAAAGQGSTSSAVKARPSSTRSRNTADDHHSQPHYEIQVDSCCGKHALNNVLEGDYVSEDAC